MKEMMLRLTKFMIDELGYATIESQRLVCLLDGERKSPLLGKKPRISFMRLFSFVRNEGIRSTLFGAAWRLFVLHSHFWDFHLCMVLMIPLSSSSGGRAEGRLQLNYRRMLFLRILRFLLLSRFIVCWSKNAQYYR